MNKVEIICSFVRTKRVQFWNPYCKRRPNYRRFHNFAVRKGKSAFELSLSKNLFPSVNHLKRNMCGIVASLSNEPVVDVLVEGLQRLEYRGYDSAGVALIEPETSGFSLRVEKHVGKVKNLATACESQKFQAHVGIAHTRWATHGQPSDVNAHPHVSSGLAVVHNGILENYKALKERLIEEGYEFKSETDTEVLAHLIRHIQSIEPDLELEEAVTLALSQVRGAFGIAVIDEAHPDKLVGARRGSPLILGVAEESLVLASDATAVIGNAAKVVYLQDEDIVLCSRKKKDGATSFEFEVKSMRSELEKVTLRTDSDCESTYEDEEGKSQSKLNINIREHLKNSSKAQIVYRVMHDLTLSLDKIEKGGYEHFMLKEIMEQPQVLRDCMRGRILEDGSIKLAGLANMEKEFQAARRIIICGCGTSWHSALVGEYLIESLAQIPVEVEYASEFRYRNPVLFEDDIIIVISQSGETADTLEAVRIAKEHGCKAFGLVNVVGSSIARATDAGVYLHIGPEIGVASTKAFTGQVACLTMLAINLAQRNGKLNEEQAKELASALLKTPELIEKILKKENCDKILQIASTYRYAHNFLYLGRGYNFPVALEGALKLKEISYIHAEGYPAAEMKHGPIALIDQMMPAVVIAPKNDKTYEKVVSAVEEVLARQGCVIAITSEGNSDFDDKVEYVIKVPPVREELSPLIATIPLQLLSYYIAKFRGCAIDQPRNLAKSVTVE